MRGFWTKKLPALALAVTMAISLATPAALATGTTPAHNYDYSKWLTDAEHHWHACGDAGCDAITDYEDHDFGGIKVTKEPTCFQTGTGVRTCQTCGYEKSESIAATGKHTAASGWTSNTTSHWHACTAASGCTAKLSEAKHTYTSGQYVTTSSQHWQICTICKGESAKSSHADSDNNGACDACGKDMPISTVTVTFKNGSSTFATQSVSKGGKPAKPATPTLTATGKTYTFKGWTTSNPGSSAIYNGQSLLSSTQVSQTAVTANTTYYAVYTVTSTAASGDIEYEVEAGESVAFDRTDFKDAFEAKYDDYDLRWVEFETDDTLSAAKGAVYYDYDGDDEKMFTASSIDDVKFYYSSSSYGDYALKNLSFYAPEDAAERTVELTYTACYSSSKYVSGTVTIELESGSSSGDAEIEYAVAPGEEVSFAISDFKKAYQEEYSGTPRWVEFRTDDTLSAAKGAVYYDYGGDDEKMFTASSIDDSKFYYSDSSYGDYALSDLSFYAPDDAGERTVELDFAVCYSNSKYVIGTLTIEISEDGSSDLSGITYEVDPGDEVDFDLSDFKEAYQEEYSGTPRWVEFETDDTLSAVKGAVYYDYGGDDEKMFTASTIDDSKFYYSDSSYGDYALEDLTFAAPEDAAERTVTLECTIYYSASKYVETTVTITIGEADADVDITYEVDPGDEVDFDLSDFKDLYQEEYSGTPRWVEFETDDTLSKSRGAVYYDYGGNDEKMFTASTIDDSKFYYSDSSYGDYALEDLTFAAPEEAPERTVTLKCTVYYSASKYVEGTVSIAIGEAEEEDDGKADITYTLGDDEEIVFLRTDFNKVYQEEYSGTIRWVEFETEDTLSKSVGLLVVDYEGDDEKSFTHRTIEGEKFYYSDESYGDYALSDLSFVSGDDFDEAITLTFRAYYSESKYVEGTLVLQPEAGSGSAFTAAIRCNTTYNTNLQINANDIVRWFKETYPTASLQYVRLDGVPESGSLYYNYYGASSYGSKKTLMTSSNRSAISFYYSPASSSQYALSELTYVPGKTNVCDLIPFTAYGSNGKSISGNILVSCTLTAVSDVYGVTPKNTSVTFPSSAIYSAILAATGTSLGSIRLLELPETTVGKVYVGSGTSVKADTSTLYTYAESSKAIGDLRFVPTSGYTGSVEIPYVAYDKNGDAIASGKFALGIVTTLKKFSDITSSTWCYKYVEELSDAGVISGYSDGSFKPNNTVTYGAALKLIMLAAGYDEQKPTGANVFSGYLTKARAEGIITRSNVDLTAPITRLQAAQIAAGALKLDTSSLSSIQPFTDTTDASVRALNAAGIVEGYFASGKSTYKPGNTLTRGQVSAIVWRMYQLDK